jgi:hypothetical protein
MSNIKLFQNQEIRSQWDADQEQWLFSVIDVVGALSGSTNPRKYWSVLKSRLKKEGSQLATNCSQLKMLSADGNPTDGRRSASGMMVTIFFPSLKT